MANNSYELELKNDKVRQYTNIAYLAVFLNLVLFSLLIVYTADPFVRINAIIATVLIVIAFIAEGVLIRSKRAGFNFVNAAFFYAILAWCIMQFWIPAFVTALLFFFFQVSRRSLVVRFTAGGVEYPSFPKRDIGWKQLSNVVLKDGLLTLDFVNNKILQAEIRDLQNGTSEADFNDFCSRYLTRS